MSAPLLEATDVVAGYAATRVVGPVSFTVHAGAPVALVGPNGAGKTTLLRAILGEAGILEGTLRRPPGTRLALVPQQTTVDPLLPTTVGEFLRLAAGPRRESRERLARLTEEWGLHSLWTRPIRNCSGGQRQRVLFVRALVRDPELLLLDEPSAALDASARAQLIADLHTLASERGIVLVTHDEALVTALDAHIVRIGDA